MPKIDVKVGDEFPAEEKGQVHHHYYHFDRHGRPRRPFRLLRLILGVMLIVFVVRLAGFVLDIPGPMWRHGQGPDYSAPLQIFYGMGSLIVPVAVIAVVLWALRRTDRS